MSTWDGPPAGVLDALWIILAMTVLGWGWLAVVERRDEKKLRAAILRRLAVEAHPAGRALDGGPTSGKTSAHREQDPAALAVEARNTAPAEGSRYAGTSGGC